jgi:hypothetical protein
MRETRSASLSGRALVWASSPSATSAAPMASPPLPGYGEAFAQDQVRDTGLGSVLEAMMRAGKSRVQPQWRGPSLLCPGASVQGSEDGTKETDR